jgi:cytochrome c heme-lyase
MGQSTSQLPSAASISTSQRPAACPVDHQRPAECSVKSQPQLAECPVKHELNPANQMPELSQLPSPSQSMKLPTERTISSIPRPSTSSAAGSSTPSNWDYPSPQQFYNALVRKGWETPEEHVETMVDIHNFLNEKAWEEVLNWEKRRAGYVFLTCS